MSIKKANGCLFMLYRAVMRPYLALHYKLKFNREISKTIKGPCIIVSNHVTVLDSFIVGTSFKMPINFVASEGIITGGFANWFMNKFVRIIPIRKGSNDPTAIKNIIGVIRQGGSVGLFPEGNATFFGETGKFKSTVGKLIKKLEVPLVIVQIRGGYNTSPRWKDKKTNKGRMGGGIKRIVTKEEIDGLSGDDINKIITDELYFNEFEYNKEKNIIFRGKRKAENLESVLFACPECGSFKDLESKKDEFGCKNCGARVKMNSAGFFEKINNAGKLPETVLEWSKIQLEMFKGVDLASYKDESLFSDGNVKVYKSVRGKKNILLSDGALKLYSDRIEAGNRAFRIQDISEVAMQRVRKLLINLNDGTSYTVLVPDKTNVFKYMTAYYHINNINNGKEDDYYGY